MSMGGTKTITNVYGRHKNITRASLWRICQCF